MSRLAELIEAAGSPLDQLPWDDETTDLLMRLVQDAITEAGTRWPNNHEALCRTILGLYAHGFMVGRDGAHLSLEDLFGIAIPDSPPET